MRQRIAHLMTLAATLAAQQITLVTPSEITEQRKQLEQAWREWESSDADLERSLFTAPADRVLARIEAGRRHAVAYHQQRARFLQTLISALQREIVGLEQADRDVAPPLLAQDARKLDILLEEQKRLERRAPPAGLSLLEERWQAEQTRLLRQLAENIAAQQAIYQALKEGQEQSRKARKALVQSYTDLTTLLEQQLRFNDEKRELWLRYYDSLRELVEARQPAAAVPKAAKAARERK
jgi:hypothetical protein